jgi:hypothetical protein
VRTTTLQRCTILTFAALLVGACSSTTGPGTVDTGVDSGIADNDTSTVPVDVSSTDAAVFDTSTVDTPAPTEDVSSAEDTGTVIDVSDMDGGTPAIDVVDTDTGVTPNDSGQPEDGGPPPPDVQTPDGALMWPDAGTLPPPEWVRLNVGAVNTCPNFVSCGGDVVGIWDVSGGCFEVDLESALSLCRGAMVTRREGVARGRVDFGSNGFARRMAESIVYLGVSIPETCTRFTDCTTIETGLRANFNDAMCVTERGGGCSCTASQYYSIDDGDFYRIEGNEIVSVSSGKRWAYCIQETQLQYRDTSTSGTREPGTIQLQRR